MNPETAQFVQLVALTVVLFLLTTLLLLVVYYIWRDTRD